MFALFAQNLLRRAGGDQSPARFVVDDLGINMFPGKMDAQDADAPQCLTTLRRMRL